MANQRRSDQICVETLVHYQPVAFQDRFNRGGITLANITIRSCFSTYRRQHVNSHEFKGIANIFVMHSRRSIARYRLQDVNIWK